MTMITQEQFTNLKGIDRDKEVANLVNTFYIPYRSCKIISQLITAYTNITLHPIEIERHVAVLKRMDALTAQSEK